MFKLRCDEPTLTHLKYGPYKQSNRAHIYTYFKNCLKRDNQVFYCKCSFKRIRTLKAINKRLKEAEIYDGKCLNRRFKKGKLRLKVPRYGLFKWQGYSFRWNQTEMQVIFKGNQVMFHLANVIDDYLMRITHIIRGKDWLTNLSKHILICVYLKLSFARYQHLPLISSPKGDKLSKKYSNISINTYLSLGILVKALFNYILKLVLISIRRESVSSTMGHNIIFNNKRLIRENIKLLKHIKPCNTDVIRWFVPGDIKLHFVTVCLKKCVLLTDMYNLIGFLFLKGFNENLNNVWYVIISLIFCWYKKITWDKLEIERLHNKLATRLGLTKRTLLSKLFVVLYDSRDLISLYDCLLISGKNLINFKLGLVLKC